MRLENKAQTICTSRRVRGASASSLYLLDHIIVYQASSMSTSSSNESSSKLEHTLSGGSTTRTRVAVVPRARGHAVSADNSRVCRRVSFPPQICLHPRSRTKTLTISEFALEPRSESLPPVLAECSKVTDSLGWVKGRRRSKAVRLAQLIHLPTP